MGRPFLKMNGLGNDFVVVNDDDPERFDPSADEIRRWGQRDGGIGFDQLISISRDGDEPFVRFWNSDGEEVSACGNGSRCVGWLLMEATGRPDARFHTASAHLTAQRAGPLAVTVDMGEPRLGWREIPLSQEMDTRAMDLSVGPIKAPILQTPGCVSMGNPHVVFFVPDVETAPVRQVGPLIERHALFPEGVNVGFAQIVGRDRIRLKVWERGAGLTLACGTGACAALVAAHRRDMTGRKATLVLDGGELVIDWRESDNHVLMTGPVAVEFQGRLP